MSVAVREVLPVQFDQLQQALLLDLVLHVGAEVLYRSTFGKIAYRSQIFHHLHNFCVDGSIGQSCTGTPRTGIGTCVSKDDCDISSSLKLGQHRSQTRSLGRLRCHTLPLSSPQLTTQDKERVVDDIVRPRILFAICTSPQCQPTAYTRLQHQHEGRGPEAVPAANGRTAPEELPGLQQRHFGSSLDLD